MIDFTTIDPISLPSFAELGKTSIGHSGMKFFRILLLVIGIALFASIVSLIISKKKAENPKYM